MSNQEFIYWLGGFADAVGKEGPTSEQWETIVSTLNQVAEPVCVPIGDGGFGTPNTTPIWQQPHYPNPWSQPGIMYKYPSDINRVTCEDRGTTSGIVSSGDSLTTISTNGSTGVTTTSNPFSTLTTGNTTTTLPKGTTLNYTANLPEDL